MAVYQSPHGDWQYESTDSSRCPGRDAFPPVRHFLRFAISVPEMSDIECFVRGHADRFSHTLHPTPTMSQAIMDPEEVRRFAKELKRFNDDVQAKAAALHARFVALSGTWQDQEHEKFAEEFVVTMKGLKKFVELSEKHTPFLLRKAQRIEEYLGQR